MKLLSKLFLAVLLLKTTVSWAACTEWNSQGECIQITVKGTVVQSSDSTPQTGHEFNLIGAFENSDEYFVGNIFFDWSSAEISVDIKAEKSGVLCEGLSKVSYPSLLLAWLQGEEFINCQELQGSGELKCSDGRKLSAIYTADSCTSGKGTGVDNDGHKFLYLFGKGDKESREWLAKMAKMDT